MERHISTAPRPSLCDEMVASQRRLLHGLELDFRVTRPLFLDSPRSWADMFLVRAQQLTQRSIGRYRLDFDMNEAGVQELWFDLEASGPEPKTRGWVEQQWPALQVCIQRLLGLLCAHIPEEKVYLTASGTGLHVRAFVRGIRSEAHRKALLHHLISEAKLGNSKCGGVGCDIPATMSFRRKVREVGACKEDKRLAGKADYTHYCTWIPSAELDALQGYPFCEHAEDVRYPSRYETVELPDAWREEVLPPIPRTSGAAPAAQVASPPPRPLSDFRLL